MKNQSDHWFSRQNHTIKRRVKGRPSLSNKGNPLWIGTRERSPWEYVTTFLIRNLTLLKLKQFERNIRFPWNCLALSFGICLYCNCCYNQPWYKTKINQTTVFWLLSFFVAIVAIIFEKTRKTIYISGERGSALLTGYFRVPKTLTFTTRPSVKPFLWNEFYLHENKKSFSYQWLRN